MNKDVTKWSKINSILWQIAATKRSYTKSVLFIDNYAFVQVIFNIGIYLQLPSICAFPRFVVRTLSLSRHLRQAPTVVIVTLCHRRYDHST